MNLFKPSVKQIERRRRLQTKGRKRFILYFGVLGFGGFMFLFMTTYELFYTFRLEAKPIWAEFIFVLVGLIIWAAGGYCWGAWMWWLVVDKPFPEELQALRDSPSEQLGEDAIPHDPRMGRPGQ